MKTWNDEGMIAQRLDTAKTLADFLNMSVATIRLWGHREDFPKIKAFRAIRFDREEVLKWMRAQNSESTR